LLRRPSLPVAATVQREHQPALPRVLAQGNRDPRSPALPHHDRGGDQQPSPPPARLPDTGRIIHSTTGRRAPCCFDALTPPGMLGENPRAECSRQYRSWLRRQVPSVLSPSPSARACSSVTWSKGTIRIEVTSSTARGRPAPSRMIDRSPTAGSGSSSAS